MLRPLKLIVIAALLWPVSGYARPNSHGSYMVMGNGTTSCGTWTADRQGDRQYGPEEWILGYLTALNRVGPGSDDITRNTDAGGIFAWVDNYCATHPLDDIATATIALGDVLLVADRKQP
jgi:hypothetical protein